MKTYTFNNKEYSDIYTLAKEMYLDCSSFAVELRSNNLLEFIQEQSQEKYDKIKALSLMALPDDVFVFKASYILNPYMTFRLNNYIFDDYQKMGEKMLSTSPNYDTVLIEMVRYNLLSEQIYISGYYKGHEEFYEDIKEIEQQAVDNHLLGYFLLAYYLSKKKTIIYKKKEYKDIYNFCYYIFRSNVDLNELGSYLSNSPLLIAYSKYSDDRIKVDEYLHICSELKKSEMKLEKFLSKRNETI